MSSGPTGFKPITTSYEEKRMTNKRPQVAVRYVDARISHPLLALPGMFCALLLGACAGTPAGNAQAGSDQECVYVRVTGSNLPVKECRSREEREAIAAREREAAQNSARDIQLLDEAGDRALGADSLP
jgi:hypothetical protein